MPHHFCTSVGDLEASIEWWRSLFGFELEFTFDIPPIKARGAFIRKQAMRIEIFEIAGSEPAPASRFRPDTDLHVQGVKHFCFAVDDVQAALETVHRAGVAIAGIARGVGKPMLAEADPTLRDGLAPASAFFIRDPWGCLVEVLGTNDFAP
jgi:catechol 2,3-dioxygenase-like lactoylglutathione lyase family enzyme